MMLHIGATDIAAYATDLLQVEPCSQADQDYTFVSVTFHAA